MTEPLEYGDSPAGPWQSISLGAAAALIDKRKYNGQTVFTEGVLIYFKKGERVFEITDVEALHGEDAQSTFQMAEVDEEGLSVEYAEDPDYEIAGDSAEELLNSIP